MPTTHSFLGRIMQRNTHSSSRGLIYGFVALAPHALIKQIIRATTQLPRTPPPHCVCVQTLINHGFYGVHCLSPRPPPTELTLLRWSCSSMCGGIHLELRRKTLMFLQLHSPTQPQLVSLKFPLLSRRVPFRVSGH